MLNENLYFRKEYLSSIELRQSVSSLQVDIISKSDSFMTRPHMANNLFQRPIGRELMTRHENETHSPLIHTTSSVYRARTTQTQFWLVLAITHMPNTRNNNNNNSHTHSDIIWYPLRAHTNFHSKIHSHSGPHRHTLSHTCMWLCTYTHTNSIHFSSIRTIFVERNILCTQFEWKEAEKNWTVFCRTNRRKGQRKISTK